jgi:hypothetical protein
VSEEAGMPRSDLMRLGAMLAVLLVVTGIVLLATRGGSDGGSSQRVATVTGVLTEVGESRLVLQPDDGGAPLTFQVRPEDARRLDLFHLRQHSSQQLSTIVTYERQGGTLYATRADDA